MARQALTIGGAIVGSFFGMPQIGFLAGSIIGGIVDPVKVEGPRLTDAKAMTARDGVPIPWGDGIFRVAGTMIACQPGKPTEHKKKKRQGKGGGPVQVTYTYTRSHAVLICEGPIVGVRRIWRNGKLVYDATALPTSADYPDEGTLIDRLKAAIKSKASTAKFAGQITIYLGDEAQLPDPTLEAMFGAGEVGANRGIAYMVVEDDDVTDTAGAVPQYEFEVARAGLAGEDDYIAGLGPEFDYRLQGDTEDRTGNYLDLVRGGTTSYGGNGLIVGSPGWASVTQGSGLDGAAEWTVLAIATVTSASGTVKRIAGHVFNELAALLNWEVGVSVMTPYAQVDDGAITLNASSPVDTDERFMIAFRRGGGEYALAINGSIVDTAPDPSAGSGGFSGSGQFVVGGGDMVGSIGYVVGYKRALTDAEIASTASYFLLDGRTYYDLPDGTGYYVTDSGEVVIEALGVGETIAQDTVTLDEFLTTICTRCGLEASDIDVTDVDEIPVTGYFVARQAGGDACLKPLLDAFQVGMFEADGKIRFVQLGADEVAALDADDLVAQDGPPVAETRAQEVELPRKINVLYSDPATAYTQTKQTSERITSDVAAVGEVNLEIPVVLTANQAAQIAHKKEKAAWIDLLGGKEFVLPDEFSYLTPTDCITLTYRGRTERLRLEKVDAEDGRLIMSARQDRQSAYSSDRTGTNPEDFIVADTLVGPTFWNVMNLPQLRPQDNVPGVYFACCGLLEGWRGCELQMSVDSGVSWITLQQFDQPSAIGRLTASITDSDATANVTMYGSGELESVTTAQVNTGSNRAAIVTASNVAEIVTFEDATLDSGGDYDVATMVRGVLNTTAAAHAADERFVHLDNINFVPIPAEYAGQTLLFRAVSLGTLESNNGEQSLTFAPAIRVIDGGGA